MGLVLFDIDWTTGDVCCRINAAVLRCPYGLEKMFIHLTQSMGKWYWTIRDEWDQEIASGGDIGTGYGQASASAHALFNSLNTR